MTSTENAEPKGSEPSSRAEPHAHCTHYEGPEVERCCVCGAVVDPEGNSPEGAPCEHGGGDVQDCPHGCAETLTPEQVAEPEPAPPQPERRPPYAVAYAVQGHLYEVALPGDATVEAVDGALVIRHSLGQVAGIVAVNPMSTKEKGNA